MPPNPPSLATTTSTTTAHYLSSSLRNTHATFGPHSPQFRSVLALVQSYVAVWLPPSPPPPQEQQVVNANVGADVNENSKSKAAAGGGGDGNVGMNIDMDMDMDGAAVARARDGRDGYNRNDGAINENGCESNAERGAGGAVEELRALLEAGLRMSA